MTDNSSSYFDVIKDPMDLSSMRAKLDEGMYKDRFAFEADFRLMIANAKQYNITGSYVHNEANTLETFFEKRKSGQLSSQRQPNFLSQNGPSLTKHWMPQIKLSRAQSRTYPNLRPTYCLHYRLPSLPQPRHPPQCRRYPGQPSNLKLAPRPKPSRRLPRLSRNLEPESPKLLMHSPSMNPHRTSMMAPMTSFKKCLLSSERKTKKNYNDDAQRQKRRERNLP